MSKKIAQLTKVVCMLNSRGEDSVDLLKETSKLHEDEIIKLKNSYELKVKDLELRLEKEKAFGDTVAFLEKSVNEKELEIIEMESKYNQLINENQLKEEMLRMKHNEEVVKLQQALVEHREKYEKELNTVQSFAQQWESHQCPDVEPVLNEKLQLECEFKRLQEKYSSLEIEVECRIKVLTDQYECKIQEIVKNLTDEKTKKETELLEINKTLLDDLKNQQSLYDQSMIRNNEEKNELSNFIKHNTEINLNNIWQQRLNQEREEFQEELSKLHKLNKEIQYKLENHIESSKLKYDQLHTEYINYQKKTKLDCEKFHRKITDLQFIEEKLKNELFMKNEEFINLEKEGTMKYLQLKNEYDDCLEKIKITEAQLESKHENQLDKQKVIANSKYEDVRLKLKESRKLLKVSENNLQLLRSQFSAQKSDLISLKKNFMVKLQEKESAIKNITTVKNNEIEKLQQANTELKLKITKQYQEYKNEINQTKTNLEQEINKLTKEIQECQLTNKEIEWKLMKECKLKENLEKQLVKLSEELKRMKNDYDELAKQTKESLFLNLEKSTRFTNLVAELDRKWSETVGRECARVRSETMYQLESQYKLKLDEITNKYEKTMATMNDQWEMKMNSRQSEPLDNMNQSRNDTNEIVKQLTKETPSDYISSLSMNSFDQCVQTDELENEIETNHISSSYNEVKNCNMIDSSTETDQQLNIQQQQLNNLLDEYRKDQSIKYEQEIKRKQIELERIQINYDKLLGLKQEELRNHFKNELHSMKQHYEMIKSNEFGDFILAQNILKSKIHELHQRLLGCSCESSSTVLKQVKSNNLSATSQLLPEIIGVNKQNAIFDTLSTSASLSPSSSSALTTGALLSESKCSYNNHDYHLLLSHHLPLQLEKDYHSINERSEEKFRLPALTT
ncbi:unnamed protein product [Schistosoma turkestanicum]|nr:unnamed protein product [Schistosoma turkestanicum]